MSALQTFALLAACIAVAAFSLLTLLEVALDQGVQFGRIAWRALVLGCALAALVLLAGCGGCPDCDAPAGDKPAAPASAPGRQPVDCTQHPELCR